MNCVLVMLAPLGAGVSVSQSISMKSSLQT